MSDQLYINFDEYIRQGEPAQRERADAWRVAIGLQAVDGLKTSEYLHQTARRNIEGEITIDEARELVKQYYVSKTTHDEDDADKEEADRVSGNIAKLLQTDAFTYSVAGLAAIHRAIFEGVFKHAGRFRDYDISKKEWVLQWDSVLYGRWQDLKMTIEYDLEQERQFDYTGLDKGQIIEHLARFVAGLWQIHPFAEGNTRTTAVFTIKYLRYLGFSVNNDLFERHSWYFRNALVRANYRNVVKGVEREPLFLIRFFRNLLLGENGVISKVEESGRMVTAAIFEAPVLSQTKPPRLFPRKTNSVRRRAIYAPVFQGNETALPPIALTATAAVSKTTQSVGKCFAVSVFVPKTASSDFPDGFSLPFALRSLVYTVRPDTQATAKAAAASQLYCGNRVPSVTPNAPGATNTPRGAAFPLLCLYVTMPPATWNRLFPSPMTHMHIIRSSPDCIPKSDMDESSPAPKAVRPMPHDAASP